MLRLSLPFFSPIHYLQLPSTVEVEENDDMSEAGSQKMVSFEPISREAVAIPWLVVTG